MKKQDYIIFLGTYERSCFGSSMEALVHIPVPIREIPIGRLMELVSISYKYIYIKKNKIKILQLS